LLLVIDEIEITSFPSKDYICPLPQTKTGLSVKEEGVNEKNNGRDKQDMVHPIVKRPLFKQSSKHVSNPLKTTNLIWV
jgi:hypothetical protein